MVPVPRSAIRLPLILPALLWVVLGCGTGYLPAAEEKPKAVSSDIDERVKALRQEKELMRLFADTFEQVKTRYVDSDVSDRKLIEAAIRGMVSTLDPHSSYISPGELSQFRKGVEREFVGIGIQVSIRDGHLQITSPLFGTPAWRAGLRAGDRILKIDGTSTRGLSIREAVKLMAGDVGTKVSVTVLHPSEEKTETVTLQRERIEEPTVIGYRRGAQGVWNYMCDEDDRIAYVRITAFSRNTAGGLHRALKKVFDESVDGLVVDLRFNPGGMLKQAVEVSDMFFDQGRIVSIEGRAEQQRAWDATPEATLIPHGFPVAVLVNRFSASAAEIVAACLRDNDIATVVGERTWGKGSVQNIVVLDGGNSALKLTTAGYHRPSGENIHRGPGASEEDQWGVQPDEGFELELTRREMQDVGTLFAKRDKLTKTRHQQDEAKPGRKEEARDQKAEKNRLVDRQLEAALEALRAEIGE